MDTNCSNYYDEEEWGLFVDIENIKPVVECNFEKMSKLYPCIINNNTVLETNTYLSYEPIPNKFINTCSTTFITTTISIIVLFFML